MQNVLIIAGGQSPEHEVSLKSATNVLQALDLTLFQPIIVYIDKQGVWHHVTSLTRLADNPVTLMKDKEGVFLLSKGQRINIDKAFPVLHGPMGEDGTIQGMFSLFGLPYVGSKTTASAVCMDKTLTKMVLSTHDIPVVPYIIIKEQNITYQEVCGTLCTDILFIKPVAMGSSVGVHKVKDEASFIKALQDAFTYGTSVLIERAINCREIECAILETAGSVSASNLGEITPTHEFYSYEAKYLDPQGAILTIPANLATDITERIKLLAIETFKCLNCQGMARVDFFLDAITEEIYVNEVNTIPGFTNISMYPKLWDDSGISYRELISKLLQYA